MADSVNIKFEGMDEVIRAIKQLGIDISKRNELLKIFRRQMKPYIKAVKRKGIIKDTKYPVKRFGVTYEPGNLRRSFKVWANKSRKKDFIYVFAGPQTKEREGSGYYGLYLLPGGSSGRVKNKNDWLKKGFNASRAAMESGVSLELRKYIKFQATKRGFQT